MTLRMLQLTLDARRFQQWAVAQRLTRAGDDLGYAAHALLAAVFGDLAPKPFRLLERGERLTLLGYARADGAALRDHARTFAEPLMLELASVAELAVKDMPGTWPAGRRLGFEVRVRPIRRQDRDGDRNRTREIDVFLAEALAVGRDQRIRREAVYTEWLAGELARGGARLESAQMTAFQRSLATRRGRDRNLRATEGPDATMRGVLSVTDGDAFARLLTRGVGRHRAFGYGMLLLRPVTR